MANTRSQQVSESERRIRDLRAEIVRLQVQRRNLVQRLNASYDSSARGKGAGRKHTPAAHRSPHGLEVERDQIDARLAALQQAIEQLAQPEAPAEPAAESAGDAS